MFDTGESIDPASWWIPLPIFDAVETQMSDLKIAHIADTHLGYRSSTIALRDDNFAEAWISACRDIVAAKPHLILHAGDVFHRPNPSWRAVNDFLEGAAILGDAETPAFMISGNHDSSRIATRHTVFSVLTEVVPFITISYDDEPQHFVLEDLDVEVVLLSHQALLSRSLRSNLESTISRLRHARFTILVSHGDVADLEKSKEMGSTVIPDFVFDFPWSYVALGHLHIAQPFGRNGWYSGSIERCGWSDAAASPGWTLTTLLEDGTVRHEQHGCPHLTMIQLPDLLCSGEKDVNIGAEILRSLSKISIPETRSVVKIQLNGVHLFARRSLQASLQRLVREHYPKLLFQVAVDSQSSIWSGPRDAPQEKDLHSVEEMFKDFVNGRTFEDPSLPAKLMETGLEALARARSVEVNREAP